MQNWLTGYASRLGLSRPAEVARDVLLCAQQGCRGETMERTLRPHGPGVLLPLAHAHVHHWLGRDALDMFSHVVTTFGMDSVEYLCFLQVNGLDEGYLDLLMSAARDEHEARGIADVCVTRTGYAIWMASCAAVDMMGTPSPDKIVQLTIANHPGVRTLVSNAGFLADNVWGEQFQHLDDSLKSSIYDEASSILQFKWW